MPYRNMCQGSSGYSYYCRIHPYIENSISTCIHYDDTVRMRCCNVLLNNTKFCHLHQSSIDDPEYKDIQLIPPPEIKYDDDDEEKVDPNIKYVFIVKNKDEHEHEIISVHLTEEAAKEVVYRLNYRRRMWSDDDWKEFSYYYMCAPIHESTQSFGVIEDEDESDSEGSDGENKFVGVLGMTTSQ